MTDSPK